MKKLWIGILIIALIIAGAVIGLVATKSSPSKSSDTAMNMSHDQEHAQANNDSAGQPVKQNTVTISNYAFSPAAISVKVGTKVTWTNTDTVAHTVTADDASGNGPDSQLLQKGASYSFTFTKAGTYNYHCTPHPYMKGTVVVTN